ncbi:MAG: xylulokinase [Acidimicrobiales bacterium]
MHTNDVVLAVDLGTGGPKVALVRTDGHVIAHELTTVETKLLPGGGATQDPDSWWDAIVTSTANLLDSNIVKREDVVGVTCTGQWGSTVAVDRHGHALGDCLLWMDTRGHPYSSRLMGGLGPIEIEGYGITKVIRFIRKTAGAPALQGNDPLGQILYLKHEEPEIFNNAAYFLEPVDFLTMRFCGRTTATPASMILSWIVDIRDLNSPRYASDLVRITTRDPKHLPELVPTGSVVATITPEVAAATTLPQGIPVIAGLPDILSAATGSGALDDFQVHMAVSTTSWMSCHVPFKKTDPFRQIATVPGVLPGRYALANNHDTAGVSLQWFRDSIFASGEEYNVGGAGGAGGAAGSPSDARTPSYSTLDQIAEHVPPGSDGVIFTPWLSGERCPVEDRTVRASFINLSLKTTRAEMTRALLEGVAYNARWMQDAVEHFLKRRVGPIRFIGGGATSDIWCQIHADVLDRRVERVRDPLLANLAGAGIYAGIALGLLDVAQAANAVSVEHVFEPDPENRTTYDELYSHFKDVYKQQKRMFKTLNRERRPSSVR